jgi:hypothetical protein
MKFAGVTEDDRTDLACQYICVPPGVTTVWVAVECQKPME